MEQWLAEKLQAGDAISADSRTVPHAQWVGWVKYFGMLSILNIAVNIPSTLR
jgi:hypothetical protein